MAAVPIVTVIDTPLVDTGHLGHRASDHPPAERPLRVCGFDPTRGVSITVNIGTAAIHPHAS